MYRNKKLYIITVLLLILVVGIAYKIVNTTSNNQDKIKVELAKCVDGDTAWFSMNGEDKKARFLYIDTPESTNQIEAYGKEASNYTCEALSNADAIYLEYNPEGARQDKYGRELVWVFVDGELLQERLAMEGYVEAFYDYGVAYLYKDLIISANEQAKQNKVGIYSNE